MPTNIDRDTFRFIERYAEVNEGHAPSYAAVADEVMGFEYIPEVSDSFTWLADRVKSFSAKKRIINLFETGEFERKLNELDGHEFVGEWLPRIVESVKMGTSVRNEIGTDIKSGSDKFLDRKSTRLNSSHVAISYAVFCWK